MITFTRTNPGTYDGPTGTYTGAAVTTISGNAVKVRGDPQTYARLNLVLSQHPTLLFTPNEYEQLDFTDDFVKPGDTVQWNGVTFTVRDVNTIAPDGVVIAARIVVSA